MGGGRNNLQAQRAEMFLTVVGYAELSRYLKKFRRGLNPLTPPPLNKPYGPESRRLQVNLSCCTQNAFSHSFVFCTIPTFSRRHLPPSINGVDALEGKRPPKMLEICGHEMHFESCE